MSNLENNTTELENLLNMTKNLPNAEDLVKVKSVNGQIGDVVLTAEDVQALPNTIDSLSYFKNDLNFADETYVNEIAGGKCKVYIKSFRSKTDPNYVTTSDEDVLEEWLKTVDKSQFNSGDVFLIRDTGVPDYWWDKDRQTIQILETTKIDLEGYLQQSDLAAAINEALAAAKASGDFRGDQGPEGPQGPVGPEGPAGPAGADGKTPIAGEDFLRPEDFDTMPIQGSSKPITSGGVYRALQNLPTGEGGEAVQEIVYVKGTYSLLQGTMELYSHTVEEVFVAALGVPTKYIILDLNLGGDQRLLLPSIYVDSNMIHFRSKYQLMGLNIDLYVAIYQDGTIEHNMGFGTYENLYVECEFDLSTFSLISISAKYQDLVGAFEAGYNIILRGSFAMVAEPVNIVLVPLSSYAKEIGTFYFEGMVELNMNGSAVMVHMSMSVFDDDTTRTKARIVSVTDIN